MRRAKRKDATSYAAAVVIIAAVERVSSTVDNLVLDLLEWVGPRPRPYAEVLEAWRTSCPQLAVWEDANDRGFITRQHAPGRGVLVSVSAAGVEHLRKHRGGR